MTRCSSQTDVSYMRVVNISCIHRLIWLKQAALNSCVLTSGLGHRDLCTCVLKKKKKKKRPQAHWTVAADMMWDVVWGEVWVWKPTRWFISLCLTRWVMCQHQQMVRMTDCAVSGHKQGHFQAHTQTSTHIKNMRIHIKHRNSYILSAAGTRDHTQRHLI